MVVTGGRGNRQNLADRLDPIGPAIIMDEAGHLLNIRSSSAWAKYVLALRSISIGLAKPAVLSFHSIHFLHPTRKAFAARSRSSPRPKQSLPIVKDDHLHGLEPSAPHGRALQLKICSLSCSWWLHLSGVGASGNRRAVHKDLPAITGVHYA